MRSEQPLYCRRCGGRGTVIGPTGPRPCSLCKPPYGRLYPGGRPTARTVCRWIGVASAASAVAYAATGWWGLAPHGSSVIAIAHGIGLAIGALSTAP